MSEDELLEQVTKEINQVLEAEHQHFVQLYRFKPVQLLAGWMCWEFKIKKDVLKNSLNNLAPQKEDLVRFPGFPKCLPDAGSDMN